MYKIILSVYEIKSQTLYVYDIRKCWNQNFFLCVWHQKLLKSEFLCVLYQKLLKSEIGNCWNQNLYVYEIRNCWIRNCWNQNLYVYEIRNCWYWYEILTCSNTVMKSEIVESLDDLGMKSDLWWTCELSWMIYVLFSNRHDI